MRNHSEKQQLLSRVITFLTREELDFIDKISKDSLFSTGSKLSRAKIIEAMVEVCMATGINGEKIKSEEELIDKIFEAIAKKALKAVKNKDNGLYEEGQK